MKKKIFFFAVIVIVLAACYSTEVTPVDLTETGPVDTVLRSTPFSKGVNFSGWFEVTNAQRISFTRYSEQDFINVKSLGADVIRLPVRLHDMTCGTPSHILDPLFLKFLDTAVDWAEKHELYIIIDNHSFDPAAPTPNDIDKVLLPTWAQIAQRYKDRSEYVIYEILNEPHGISDRRWGEIQGMAIETIRSHDQNRLIIVGGADFNSYIKLSAIPDYSDPNLIYTFHFYDPFAFTHQGAGWAPPMEYLSGVPFPADRSRMPKVNAKLRGTWVEGMMQNYARDASPASLLAVLDKTAAFSRKRDVPIFCGEFGVYMINSDPEDRVLWYKFVTEALNRRGISWTSWDYFGGFGIFNFDGRGDFYSDLNVDLVRVLGFTPPPQVPRNQEPLNAGFVIFDDYPASHIYTGFWGSDDTDLSFYETNSAEGDFAIRWENANQYSAFWFAFSRNGDFSVLAKDGYVIEFLARTEKPVTFDIRFLNPENQVSVPWRMSYTINEDSLAPDGNWHTVRIPLNEMREQGAWVNSEQKWLTPRDEFAWDNIERLEFASERMDLRGHRILFDNIRITVP